MDFYTTQSPVLFIVFNRPDVTFQVFEKIREAKPSRLYIAADGPRLYKEGEDILCEQSRSVLANIDWNCKVETLYRIENVGCKYAVSSAISWFFSQEEEGIILEDDCLPSNDFFRFCDIMLEQYRFDSRIRHITGCNLQFNQKWGEHSYYFSKNTHVWGWAGWKRVWDDYDVELSRYNPDDSFTQLSNVFNNPAIAKKWSDVFYDLKTGEIDTWDYQLALINYFNNGLCIIPNENLISNIGFREDGTHTKNTEDEEASLPFGILPEELSHPLYIIPEEKADIALLNRHFGIQDVEPQGEEKKKRKNRFFKLFKPSYD